MLTPVSPELIHEAAEDVWMFLLTWSLTWQFEGRKVGVARTTIPKTQTTAQLAALHQLKQYVEEFVSGLIVPCEGWATILKTTRLGTPLERKFNCLNP